MCIRDRANTNRLVLDSWQHTYRTLTGKEADEAVIKATFGEPLPVSMEKAFPDTPADESIAIYRGHQKDIYEEMIEAFDGMPELMKALKEKGYLVAIVTSRMRTVSYTHLSYLSERFYAAELSVYTGGCRCCSETGCFYES